MIIAIFLSVSYYFIINEHDNKKALFEKN